MALGGGTFTTQNKVLPGSYINFVSTRTASATMSERGAAAIGLNLDWGAEDAIVTLMASDFMKNSLKIFGKTYTDTALRGIRDIFKNAQMLYVYRLNAGSEKARNDIAEAKYGGTRGNALKIAVEVSADDGGKKVVKTYLDTVLVDSQTVSETSELVENDFVVFKTDASLTQTAGTALTGGTDGTVAIENHQKFLDKIESYFVNAVGYVPDSSVGVSEDIAKLYAESAKIMRDQRGQKIQTVVYNTKADSEAVVNVKNCPEAVYWVLGVIAGTAVNKSALNKEYDGEFDIPADYTQTELEDAMKNGEFVLHRVGDSIRVLDDINSLVTFTQDKGDIFQSNQTIRIVDQVATDIATIFNTNYLGRVPNDASGRESLFGDVITLLKNLRNMRAIEAFDESTISVSRGEAKNSVVVSCEIEIIGAMAKLYMTCIVS